jgi:cell filamentation protein
MERSPVKDIEINFLLQQALTGRIHDSEVYRKGIDASCYYEGYADYRAEDLGGNES